MGFGTRGEVVKEGDSFSACRVITEMPPSVLNAKLALTAV